MRPFSKRGNAVMAVMMGTTLITFVALSVDIGLVRVARSQLRVAADSAALAAAASLDGTEDGLRAAEAAASALASAHAVLGGPVTLDGTGVVFGRHDEAGEFVEETEPSDVDAIQIRLTPRDVKGVFASAIFSTQSITVSSRVAARRPAGDGPANSSTCFLPIAVPDCHVTGLAEGLNPEPLVLHMGEATPFTPAEQQVADTLKATLATFEEVYGETYVATMEDLLAESLWPGGVPPSTIAWARPDQAPEDVWISEQVADRCSGGVIEVGELVYVDDNVREDALSAVVDVLNNRGGTDPDEWIDNVGSPTHDGVTGNLPWNTAVDDSAWTNTLQGPVALVQADGCEAPTFDGPLTVTGIAWGALYEARTDGDVTNLWLQLDLVGEYEVWGGVDEESVGKNVLGKGAARYARNP